MSDMACVCLRPLVLILLFVVQIRFKIFEAGHKRGGKMPQRKHLIPFVGRTICAQLSDAFVAVAGTGKSGTRNIQENAADRTFLFHAFLLGWGRYGSLILANPPKIAKKETIFCMGVPVAGVQTTAIRPFTVKRWGKTKVFVHTCGGRTCLLLSTCTVVLRP